MNLICVNRLTTYVQTQREKQNYKGKSLKSKKIYKIRKENLKKEAMVSIVTNEGLKTVILSSPDSSGNKTVNNWKRFRHDFFSFHLFTPGVKL